MLEIGQCVSGLRCCGGMVAVLNAGVAGARLVELRALDQVHD
jgi:hypothetical protein